MQKWGTERKGENDKLFKREKKSSNGNTGGGIKF